MFRKVLYTLMLSATGVNAQDVTTAGEDTVVTQSAPKKKVTRNDDRMYKMNYKVDVPIIVVGGGATIYTFGIIYTKEASPEADILALDKKNIPEFDRWATKYHDTKTDEISYYPFYAVMPLPLILMLDPKMRKDAGSLGLLYLESFAFTGVVYAGSVYFVDRYRPDVYNTSLDMDYRKRGNYRNSFFAGHVAVVANSTFFIAKVFDDYHPHSPWKWAVYGGAAAATIGMGYMRLEAGKHFPSDIALGALVGTASGLLVPIIHKNKDRNKQKWTLVPDVNERGGSGLRFTYKL